MVVMAVRMALMITLQFGFCFIIIINYQLSIIN